MAGGPAHERKLSGLHEYVLSVGAAGSAEVTNSHSGDRYRSAGCRFCCPFLSRASCKTAQMGGSIL